MTRTATPNESESAPSEAATATVGGVTLSWGEPVKRSDGYVEIVLSISNSLHYDATGLVVSNAYDAAALRFHKVEATGLSEGLKWTLGADGALDGAANPTGLVTLTVTGGEVAAGRGKLFTFLFEDLTAVERVLRGDMNFDGALDARDKRQMQFYVANPRRVTAKVLAAGDFNGDGKITAADYQALLELLKGEGVR